MLKAAGVRDLVMCDSKGVLTPDRADLNDHKRRHAAASRAKTVGEALAGADVFIGVSVAECIRGDEVRSMAAFPAIFAMANPDPEIQPDAVAAALGKDPYVMATGRSDYPNQVNNVLGFPFLFRGALDTRAKTINVEMKVAAAKALAALARSPVPAEVKAIYGEDLAFGPRYMIPKPFDRRLFIEIPSAVAVAAVATGVAQRPVELAAYRRDLEERNRRRLA